jgi:hypothetical protein
MGAVGIQRAIERYSSQICAEVHLQAFQAAILRHRQRRLPAKETIAS